MEKKDYWCLSYIEVIQKGGTERNIQRNFFFWNKGRSESTNEKGIVDCGAGGRYSINNQR